jgi:hypothetical protein
MYKYKSSIFLMKAPYKRKTWPEEVMGLQQKDSPKLQASQGATKPVVISEWRAITQVEGAPKQCWGL